MLAARVVVLTTTAPQTPPLTMVQHICTVCTNIQQLQELPVSASSRELATILLNAQIMSL